MPSLKPLKSVAHNVIHQFASTLTYWDNDYGINHLAHSVLRVGGSVSIDLLSGSCVPRLERDGNEAVLRLACALPRLMEKEGFPPSLLDLACARFDFQGPAPVQGGNVRYDCLVELRTIDGRQFQVRVNELNAP
jgi:hypothetical protein